MSALPGSEITPQFVEVPDRNHNIISELSILILMAHSRCNCRCVMCDIWRTAESRDLTLSDLEPHLASIRDLRVQWVVFSGGEPLMNPGLFVLAAALRKLNIRLTLLTAGLLIGKYASEIAESMDEVIVSLDGPAVVHNEIRRVPHAFETMSAGIARVQSLSSNLPIRARTTVQRSNHRCLRETVRVSRELGLASVSFLAADVTSTAFNRELIWPLARQEQVALTHDEILSLGNEIEELIREYGQEIATGFIAESPYKLRRIVRQFRAQLGLEAPIAPPCNAPWVSAVIEVNGDIRPCFFHAPIGKLGATNLKDALNSDRALNFRRELQVDSNAVCKRCVCSLYRQRS
ncbi:MAG: radical SAM protein [Terriglobia bacterium]|nr:radical SAM protein [Terriglobia bacterium]